MLAARPGGAAGAQLDLGQRDREPRVDSQLVGDRASTFPASSKSAAVRPPSEWVEIVTVTVSQEISRSGWWPIASAGPTRLSTKLHRADEVAAAEALRDRRAVPLPAVEPGQRRLDLAPLSSAIAPPPSLPSPAPPPAHRARGRPRISGQCRAGRWSSCWGSGGLPLVGAHVPGHPLGHRVAHVDELAGHRLPLPSSSPLPVEREPDRRRDHVALGEMGLFVGDMSAARWPSPSVLPPRRIRSRPPARCAPARSLRRAPRTRPPSA